MIREWFVRVTLRRSDVEFLDFASKVLSPTFDTDP